MRRPRSWRRAPLWVLSLALVAALAFTGWVGLRGWWAKQHLAQAQTLTPRLVERARTAANEATSDPAVAAQTTQDLATLHQHTSAARGLTSDWAWGLACALPVVGDDLSAARDAARAADRIATGALPPLLGSVSLLQLSAVRPAHGRIDLAPLQRAQEPLRRAEQAVRLARADLAPHLAAAGQGRLVQPLADAVQTFDTSLKRLSQGSATARRAADLLPGMLGGQEIRRYLVVVQDLARPRSLGGSVAAVAVLEADHGRVRVTRAASGAPFAEITRATDFTTAAEQARQRWAQLYRQPLDGVISLDQVVLSEVLYTTGQITLRQKVTTVQPAKLSPGMLARLGPAAQAYLREHSGPVTRTVSRTVTSRNVVSLLTRQVYDQVATGEAGDQVTGAVAGATFAKVLSSSRTGEPTVRALSQAAREGRLMVWSSRPSEQARLAGTVLEGRLPVRESYRPTVAVFLNDPTTARLGYYLRSTVTAKQGCASAGQQATQLTVALSRPAPAAGVPSVMVPGHAGATVDAAHWPTRMTAQLVGPVGGTITAVTVDGRPLAATTTTVAGRPVVTVEVSLGSNGTSQVRAVLSGPALPATGRVRTTPSLGARVAVSRSTECHRPAGR